MSKGSARRPTTAVTAKEWDAAWLRIFAEKVDDDAPRPEPEPVLEGDDIPPKPAIDL